MQTSIAESGQRVVAILQARMGSTRLPGKVLMDLGGTTALGMMCSRVKRATQVDDIVIATSDQPEDDAIAAEARRLGVGLFRGDEHDVLKRYRDAAASANAEVIVRLTGDCPCVDPQVLDDALNLYRAGSGEYVSNVIERSYPDGLDVEVFSRATLEDTHARCKDTRMREHVTPFMRTGLYLDRPSGGYSVAHLRAPADFSNLRWTLDESDDLDFFRAVLPLLKPDFSWIELVSLLTARPDLLSYNRQKKWRVGALADMRGQTSRAGEADPVVRYAQSNIFFKRALESIPLASQTFSKSYQQYVLGAAPLFLKRGKGARVEDIDGNGYIDYVSGLLSIVLGYCDSDVDAAIVSQLENGISFSLATTLEAELGEILRRLIPCCEQVRFGKNGSDATTAAVRLARAHTSRSKIIVCGYHGWHDWYIGTTTRRLGVPDVVQALTTAMPFGDADKIAELLKSEPDAYAAIILEPAGAAPPPAGYLEAIRQLCDKYGVVLIFDEIITGFRIHMGGAQTLYGVTPDLATFGKAMGNGMPISAVVGRKNIMRRMEDIFFSATFGGEALSLAAAIATIRKLERDDIVAKLWSYGAALSQELNQALSNYELSNCIEFTGDGWWPRVKMKSPHVPATLFTSLLRQSLNAHGLLLGASLNLNRAHLDPSIRGDTLERFRRALAVLRLSLDSSDPSKMLQGAPIQPTFSVR